MSETHSLYGTQDVPSCWLASSSFFSRSSLPHNLQNCMTLFYVGHISEHGHMLDLSSIHLRWLRGLVTYTYVLITENMAVSPTLLAIARSICAGFIYIYIYTLYKILHYVQILHGLPPSAHPSHLHLRTCRQAQASTNVYTAHYIGFEGLQGYIV